MTGNGDRDLVLAMLEKAALTPTPDEIDRLVAGYPTMRAMVDRLYNLPGVRYEEPAVTFDPRVTP